MTEWMNNFETKLKPFLEMTNKIGEEEAVKLGKKNPEAYPWQYLLIIEISFDILIWEGRSEEMFFYAIFEGVHCASRDY